MLASGDQIGPYRITGVVGAGGMGVVYAARDPRIDRDVAIKVMASDVADDPDRRVRFEREARAIGAISHPNVMVIHDAGEHDAAPYLVTELLRGESLRARLERGPIDRERAVAIARQVARGLAAVHERGIVHRDLKPSNLFLCDDGTVKILDFGVARRLQSDDTVTRSGAVLGTPRYMSPEQVRGRELTPQSDLFSLGVVLHEMLAGARPFGGDSDLEVAAAILEQPPPPLDDARLGPIVRRCLAKQPEERFASASALEAALAAGHAPRRWRRNAVVATAVAATAAGSVMWSMARAKRDPRPVTAPPAATKGVLAPTGRAPVEHRLTSLPRDRWVISLAVDPAGELFAYSNHDGLFVQRPGGGQPRRIGMPPGITHMNVYGFTPDSRRLLVNVATDHGADIAMLDLADGAIKVIKQHAHPWRLAPDGRTTLVSAPDGTPTRLTRLDIESGDDHVVEALGTAPHVQFHHSWSPSSRYLAMIDPWPKPTSDTTSLVVVPLEAGAGQVIPFEGDDLVQRGKGKGVAWRDDHRLLYVSSDADGGNSLWEVGIAEGRWDGQPATRLYTWSEGSIGWMSYRGDRLFYVKSREKEDVYLRELDAEGNVTGEPVRLTQYDGEDEFRGGWTHDGRVLFASDRFGTWDVFAQAPGAADAEVVVGGPSDDRDPIAAGDAVLFWRHGADGEACRLMRLEPDAVEPVEVLARPCERAFVACASRAGDRCALVELVGKVVRTHMPLAVPETTVVSRLNPVTGEVHELHRAPTEQLGSMWPPDVDPDGEHVIMVSDGDLATIDLLSGELAVTARDVEPGGLMHAASAGPLGGWLTQPRWWNTSGLVRVRPDGEKTLLWAMGSDKLRFPRVSPDGHYLAAGVIDIDSNVWMLEDLP